MRKLWIALGAASFLALASLPWLGWKTTEAAVRPRQESEEDPHKPQGTTARAMPDQKALLRIFLLVGLARK